MPKDSRTFYSEMGVQWLSDRKDPLHTDEELTYLLDVLRTKNDVLDLACGFGRFSIPLARKGYNVTGIDITPIFIERAREIADQEGLQIQFSVGDMRNITYDDSSFDAVICMWNAFSEIVDSDDQIKVIREIYRVLKNDGMGLIEVRNHRSPKALTENYIDDLEAMPKFQSHKRYIKKDRQ
ncbi:MAG: methyltransferase [Thermoplasmatales archaeon E-plasma]|nr:MAG: methyltransferase [Thermoplasmatales archaeon E-plasma]